MNRSLRCTHAQVTEFNRRSRFKRNEDRKNGWHMLQRIKFASLFNDSRSKYAEIQSTEKNL